MGKSEKSLNALLFLLTQDLVMTLDNVILFEQSRIKEVQEKKIGYMQCNECGKRKIARKTNLTIKMPQNIMVVLKNIKIKHTFNEYNSSQKPIIIKQSKKSKGAESI